MKKNSRISFLLVLLPFIGFSQKTDSTNNKWEVNAVALLNFIPNYFFVTPVVNIDKNELHLESRYNYEDLKTISFFGGYNFTGGNKLQYVITPILGVVMGNTDGIAPGLKIDLNRGRFRFYSEMEYLFSINGRASSFYFNWSEFSYAPTDWFWVGVTAQRTHIYANDVKIQRGFLAGLRRKNIYTIGYLLNPFTENTIGIAGLGIIF
ncbi:MAG: hypothetical protein ACRC2O_13260 [Chitinophagaceae bacterium]